MILTLITKAPAAAELLLASCSSMRVMRGGKGPSDGSTTTTSKGGRGAAPSPDDALNGHIVLGAIDSWPFSRCGSSALMQILKSASLRLGKLATRLVAIFLTFSDPPSEPCCLHFLNSEHWRSDGSVAASSGSGRKGRFAGRTRSLSQNKEPSACKLWDNITS